MQKAAAKYNNNFMSWLWSYITWPYTQTVAYFYPRKDAQHKKHDDHTSSSLIRKDITNAHPSNFRTASGNHLEVFPNIPPDEDGHHTPQVKTKEKSKEVPSATSWTTNFNKLMDYSEWAPYKACKKTYNLIAPIVGHAKLNTILSTQFILTLFLNVANIYIANQMAKDKGLFDKLLANIIPANQFPDNDSSYSSALNIGKALGHNCLISTGIFLINECVLRVSELMIKYSAADNHIKNYYEPSAKEVDSGHQPLFVLMSATPQSNSVIPTSLKDNGTVIRLANKISVSAITTGFNGLIAAVELCRSTQRYTPIYSNPLFLKGVFSLVASTVSGALSYMYGEKRKEATPLINEIREDENNNHLNYLHIGLLGGRFFATSQSNIAMNKIRPGEIITTGIESLMKGCNHLIKQYDRPLNYLLTILQILQGNTTAQPHTTLMHMENFSNLSNWAGDNNLDISSMTAPLDNLETYHRIKQECLDHKPTFDRSFKHEKEEIIIPSLRIYKHAPSEPYSPRYIQEPENNKDYKLIFNLREPLTIKLKTEMDEPTITLIHSDSGHGKTTLLNALNNISLPGAPVSGTFCFPKTYAPYTQKDGRPNIFMLPQMVQMPVHVSFFELLCYPTPVTTSKTASSQPSFFSFNGLLTAMGLLTHPRSLTYITPEREKEILRIAASVVSSLNMGDKFGDFIKDPHIKKDTWNDKGLSGGERIVFPVIWSILQNPKLLIMDEPDANLDDRRITALHSILKKFLPNTPMIIISHNKVDSIDPETHPFYNQKIHLAAYNSCVNEEQQHIETRAATPMLNRSTSVIQSLLDGMDDSRTYSLEQIEEDSYSISPAPSPPRSSSLLLSSKTFRKENSWTTSLETARGATNSLSMQL